MGTILPNPDDFWETCKKEQLNDVLKGLPLGLHLLINFNIDLHQSKTYIYKNVTIVGCKLVKTLETGVVDRFWYRKNNLQRSWRAQLHLYKEVPFYYIEYGMAQLGAIAAMWRNLKQNPKQALENLKSIIVRILKTIPELYAAGIKFDFSPVYVKELADFSQEEY